jgi:chorismate mutase
VQLALRRGGKEEIDHKDREPNMPCRGVRGATTADSNSSDAILKATRELLALMIRQNGIRPDDVASAVFSTTVDLDAEFPALAARQLGWLNVALMCVHELDVPGSLRHCVRILLHWNTDKSPGEIIHVYIKEAANLRPDRGKLPPVDWDELEHWIAAHVDEGVKSSRK